MSHDKLMAAYGERILGVETIDGWIKPPFRVRKVDTTTARVQSSATPSTDGHH